MDLGTYYDKLRHHDWNYEYSEDRRYLNAGRAERSELASIACKTPEHRALYEAYRNYIFKDYPQPKRPE